MRALRPADDPDNHLVGIEAQVINLADKIKALKDGDENDNGALSASEDRVLAHSARVRVTDIQQQGPPCIAQAPASADRAA